MRESFSDMLWYKDNILKSVTEWEQSGDVTVSGHYVTLGHNASIQFSLSNEFMSDSLAMSYARKIVSVIDNSNSAVTNMQNFKNPMNAGLKIIVENTYSSDTEVYTEQHSFIYNTANRIKNEDGIEKHSFYIDMLGLNLLESTITLFNASSSDITIRSVKMYRSQDVTQVGENTRTSMTVTDITAYKDGLTVQFDSKSAPVRMWWQEDEDGNFSGVNIDGERMITFKRVNQSLPQQEDS